MLTTKFKRFVKIYNEEKRTITHDVFLAFRHYSDKYATINDPKYNYITGFDVNGIFYPALHGDWTLQFSAPDNSADSIELFNKHQEDPYSDPLHVKFTCNKYGVEKEITSKIKTLVHTWADDTHDIEFAIISRLRISSMNSNICKCKVLAVKDEHHIFGPSPFDKIIRGDIDDLGVFIINKDGEWVINSFPDNPNGNDGYIINRVNLSSLTVFNQYANMYNTVSFYTDWKGVYVLDEMNPKNGDIVIYVF